MKPFNEQKGNRVMSDYHSLKNRVHFKEPQIGML